MFRTHIFIGVAHAPGTHLLRQTAEAGKFSTILLLLLTQNVLKISCSHNIGNTISDGYASWAATKKTGAIGRPLSDTVAVAAVDTHRLAKRMDLELCLGKFEIHKNTIIRTGESQTLGGKYLQGLELDTAEECQRLCCETESCDVYVFEDKTDGYCYLFECGPPENFHCKFTRHANYTSAVLTVSRHLTEITTSKPIVAHATSNNNISQQEFELTSLKVKPEVRDKMVSATGTGGIEGATSGASAAADTAIGAVTNAKATAASATMLSAEQLQPLSGAFPQKVYPAHCGRFQFTCHSGECIAVYNACDGIPQCEDGSDEGPECSGATSTVKSNTMIENTQKVAPAPQFQPPLLQQTAKQQIQSVQQQTHPQQGQQTQPAAQMLPGVIPPLINNREDAGAWANRKTVAADVYHVEQASNDVELNSRIFSHKGGIQVPTTGVNANNNPNSALVTSYANPNSNNNNNPNLNLNPVYNAATLQRNGIYMPQANGLATSGIYGQQQQQSPAIATQQQQQPQYVVPQGHLILPPNVQWQMQQQQPQMPMQQTLPLSLQPGPPYIINNAGQQPEMQRIPAIKTAAGEAVGATPDKAAQQQTQADVKQQVAQQSVRAGDAVSAKSNASPLATAQKVDTNKLVASKTPGTQTAAGEDSDEYDDDEKSTEPPKKGPLSTGSKVPWKGIFSQL
ncbi:uncharacterized protein [Eurosta solidaginis]|uniref:uncharacterized protein isoform X2 n=1 Tax=Eurosta solidaginis TaxID=178769 RepID=UPI0035316878